MNSKYFNGKPPIEQIRRLHKELHLIDKEVKAIQAIDEKHNDGSILWVSDTGNNATAEKGNQHSPYADPFAARDAAVAGDVIWVLSGTYDVAVINPPSANLFLKQLTYQLNPGVRIIGNAQTIEPQSSGVYKITGNGSLENYRLSFPVQDCHHIIELDNLEISDSDSATGPVIGVGSDASMTNIKIKNLTFNGTLNYVFSLGGTGSDIDVEIGNLYFESLGVPGWQVFRVGGLINTRLNLKVSNSRIAYDMSTTEHATIFDTPDFFGLIRGLYQDAQVTASFGNVEILNTQLTYGGATADRTFTGKSVCTLGAGYGSTFENTKVAIIFDNIKTPNKVLSIHADNSQGGTCVNSQFDIDLGNATSTESVAITIYDFQGADSRLNIKGNVIAEKRDVIEQYGTAPAGKVTFSGIYESRLASNVVADITHSNLIFRDAILLNDGVAAPIAATNAVNTKIMNVFSNSLIVDGNTTELITTIIRDADVN